ncbi:hypothetical protein JF546_07970 [Nitratireductor aquimarinus]|uniref:hypothetical protein n=1 Tax=Nitratireductor aquimarinus TaxID=889300 RepID=UPI001A8D5354|nr:hypothetical protein [Nitratireductor aquimarinus]MBN8242942.1 hypothetical protein [Nitratireductor aquimarinus]MBY6132043.1 hypothetical protein [Nitratireductor aquimarinus]MCA1301579.1 hypothetical protein [Nitratireductor aquimarinus]
MSKPADNISESPAYWTHKVEAFPSPVAQFRMAQLIDLDDRLYENARIVYRFLVGWYHDGHGDALLSMRHVSKVMRARAPDGAAVLSHSVVQRAIIALMETGWVVRTYKGRGKGKGASRFVPVLNVLELAAQGKFPELSHSGGTVEPSHSSGTAVSRTNGTVDAELSRSNGTKTLLRDPPTGGITSNSKTVSAAPPSGLTADGAAGFEKVWKAYGKLGDKRAAQAVYAAIENPDIDHIASRAASWAASARPGQKRMPLEKWLAAEKYDEADRRVEPTKPAGPQPAATDDEPIEWVGDVSAIIPPGMHGVTVKTATATWDGSGTKLTLAIDIDTGRLLHGDVEHSFYTEHHDIKVQARGQKHLEQLAQAAGIDIEDSSQLVGLRAQAIVGRDGSIRYVPLADNDDHEEAA